jgi:hypothetical protein
MAVHAHIRAMAALALLAATACEATDVSDASVPFCETARPISDLTAPLGRLISEYVVDEMHADPHNVRVSLHSGQHNPAKVDPATHQAVHIFVGCTDMEPGDVWLGRAVVVAVDRRDGAIQTLGLGP